MLEQKLKQFRSTKESKNVKATSNFIVGKPCNTGLKLKIAEHCSVTMIWAIYSAIFYLDAGYAILLAVHMASLII